MKKVRCICSLYFNITLGKVYDVIKYNYYNDLSIYTIEILDDDNINKLFQFNVSNGSGRIVGVFEDATIEFRNETISEILS